jgi:hypothetical protein
MGDVPEFPQEYEEKFFQVASRFVMKRTPS